MKCFTAMFLPCFKVMAVLQGKLETQVRKTDQLENYNVWEALHRAVEGPERGARLSDCGLRGHAYRAGLQKAVHHWGLGGQKST